MADRFECSAASSARDEAVTATASQVRAWLLLEVHGAWGPDAIVESQLGTHLPKGWEQDLRSRGIRPVCIRPPDHRPAASEIRIFFVLAERPGLVDGMIWTRSVPNAAVVRFVTDDLQAGREPEGWHRHDDRIVLVCTNGKHDQCCANRGRPVVRHLGTSRWSDQVWECSHIGGDRFAANLVVLPESLYFGRMQPAESEQILDSHDLGEIELAWFRGRSTMRFVEQAAEQAIRVEFAKRRLDDVVVTGVDRSGVVHARVAGIGEVEVRTTRQVIVVPEPLTCQGTPHQEIPRYAISDIAIVGR